MEKKAISIRMPHDRYEFVRDYGRSRQLTMTESLLELLDKGIEASRNEVSNDVSESRYEELKGYLLRVLDAVEESSGTTREDVIQAIAATSANFEAIRRAVLFGSFARDEARASSDIDVRLELDRSVRFGVRELVRFSSDIERATGRNVDVLTVDRIENPNLEEAIRREGVVVYEREA